MVRADEVRRPLDKARPRVAQHDGLWMRAIKISADGALSRGAACSRTSDDPGNRLSRPTRLHAARRGRPCSGFQVNIHGIGVAPTGGRSTSSKTRSAVLADHRFPPARQILNYHDTRGSPSSTSSRP
jgi:hypothetical protein